jgi:hypothetical protein
MDMQKEKAYAKNCYQCRPIVQRNIAPPISVLLDVDSEGYGNIA